MAPFLPPPRRTGRPRRWPMREIIDAIFYVLRAGCPWRMLPDSFPPVSAVHRWFAPLRDRGVFTTIDHHLLMRDRERTGREAGPSAAVIDSQSVKSAQAGGPRGYDAGKKVKGRKRHAMVDTDGRALVLQAHPASVQDRDGAVPLPTASRRGFPFVERAFADSAYAGDRVADATRITVEIIRKHPDQVGFTDHPRRWVVERFFARIGRNLRLGRDCEGALASVEGFLCAASVMLLVRRLARAG